MRGARVNKLAKIKYFLLGVLALAVIITIIPPIMGIEIKITTVLALVNILYRFVEWVGRKIKNRLTKIQKQS